MKITIYELLGLIKEDKAPNKIKYGNMFYKKYKRNYKGIDVPVLYLFDFDFFECCNLNDEVEIIEEIIEEEKEIEFDNFSSYTYNVGRVDESNIEEYIHTLFSQQMRLIENQKKIIDVINDMRDKEC